MNDPQLTFELNRFNLEYNFTPVVQKTMIQKQMHIIKGGVETEMNGTRWQI
jgi:hypothetical protein